VANEVIIFGSPEGMAVTWLTGKLGTGVKISTKVPAPRPAKFARVLLTGGPRLDLAYREAQLTFQGWGATETEAEDICNLAYGHIFAVAGETVNGVFVRKVREIGGVVNFEDPESTSPRYQFTVGAACRYVSLGA
jgi:hypothetical protein